MNNVKLHFLIKFLTKYFFYGYLCFFGIIIFSLITYFVMKNLLFPMNLFGLLSFLILILIFVQFVRIIISTKQKYRYYKITKYRLENREFKEEFFIVEMYEPCFRLIVKDLLYSYGFAEEYKKLKAKCKEKDLRVEKAKERLLAKVKKEHEKGNKA